MDANDLKNFRILTPLINEGDVLVDVGANYGDYTELFSKCLNGSGRVYSIELHPDTYNVLNNKFGHQNNTIVLNYGVSNTNEPIPFYRGNDSWTNNIIGHDTNFRVNEKIGIIQGIRLDTLLKNEQHIKILKIDVEGAENLVLEGLEGIYDRVEYMLLECHLDEDWLGIRDMILNKYNFKCINLGNNQEVDNNSDRPYQCFCKR